MCPSYGRHEMDGHATLRAQLAALADRRRNASEALAALQSGADGLLAAVGGALIENADELGGEIERLQDAHAAGEPLSECWVKLEALDERAQELFGEYLALAEGAWARRHSVDSGMCTLADALLEELEGRLRVGWDRFTIPAESEFFGRLAQVVRVRVPTLGLWDLPLVVHELGHFAAERLEDRQREGYIERVVTPLRDFLDEAADRSDADWAFTHEYIADAFATYALGLAYPYACVLLRFEPTGAREPGYTHPAPAARVELMFGLLDLMDGAGTGMTKFGKRAATLREVWEQTLAGVAEAPDGNGESDPPPVQRLFDMLQQTRPSGGYGTFHRAQALAPRIAQAAPDAPAAAAVPPETTMADVVNAAWLARVDAWDGGEATAQRIRQSATRLCEQLLERGAGS